MRKGVPLNPFQTFSNYFTVGGEANEKGVLPKRFAADIVLLYPLYAALMSGSECVARIAAAGAQVRSADASVTLKQSPQLRTQIFAYAPLFSVRRTKQRAIDLILTQRVKRFGKG